MRFPGKRRSKHYFPVSAKGRLSFETDFNSKENVYIVGIDQLLVDIEIDAPTDLLKRYKLSPGESYILPDHIIEELYQDCLENDKILGQYAGGAVGNTLHNYSVLSDDQSFALGTICENIKGGDYSYRVIPGNIKTDQLIDGHRSRSFDHSGIKKNPSASMPIP